MSNNNVSMQPLSELMLNKAVSDNKSDGELDAVFPNQLFYEFMQKDPATGGWKWSGKQLKEEQLIGLVERFRFLTTKREALFDTLQAVMVYSNDEHDEHMASNQRSMHVEFQQWQMKTQADMEGRFQALLEKESAASKKRIDAAKKQPMGESQDEVLVQRLKNALEKNQTRYTALLEQKKMIEHQNAQLVSNIETLKSSSNARGDVDALASVFFLNARRAYDVSQEGIFAMKQKTAKLGKSWVKLTTLAKHVAELKNVQRRISKAQQKYVQAKGNVIRAIGDGTAKMVGLDAMIKTDQKYVDGTLLPKIRMLRASELKLLQDEQKFYQEEQKIVLERQKRKLARSVGMSMAQLETQQNNTFIVTPSTPQQQLVQPETPLIKDFNALQLMDTAE